MVRLKKEIVFGMFIIVNFCLVMAGTDNLQIPNSANSNNAQVVISPDAFAKFIKKGGDNANGQYNFNGGWLNGGLSIIDGDIYAKTGYFYNLTSLTISSLNINGSQTPVFDNLFDLGSATNQWRNIYAGTDVIIGGAGINKWMYNQSLGVHLNEVLNPQADKSFNMGQRSLSFNFVNPSNQPTFDGAFEIQASGAFTGDLVHIHQHTGNPGANTDLLHLEAEDTDVIGLNISTAIGNGAFINGQNVDKWLYNQTLGVATGTNYWQTNGTAINNATAKQVGIGTSTPMLPLHIWTGNAGTDPNWAYGSDQLLIEDEANAIIQLFSATSSALEFSKASNRLRGAIVYTHAGDTMDFYTSATKYMTLNGTGYLGIGTSVPVAKLQVNGTIPALISGSVAAIGADAVETLNINGGIGGAATTTDISSGATAGKGSSINITSGRGGFATTGPTGTATGGAGGDIFIIGNNGGGATGVSATNTGGNGGNIFISGGLGGVGSTANGNEGKVNISGMMIINSTSVGIGTNIASDELDLNGSMVIDNQAAGNLILFKRGGTSLANFNNGGVVFNIRALNNKDIDILDSTSKLWLHFENGGNVGVGTNQPSYALEINNTFANALNVSGFLFANSTSLGLGTTNTKARFTLNDTGGGTITMGALNGNSIFSGISFSQVSLGVTTGNYSLLGEGTSTYINTPLAGTIYFRENNANRGAIVGGNFGMGTVTPKYTIEVNNNTQALNVSNNLFANSTTVEIKRNVTYGGSFKYTRATDDFTIPFTCRDASGTGAADTGTECCAYWGMTCVATTEFGIDGDEFACSLDWGAVRYAAHCK